MNLFTQLFIQLLFISFVTATPTLATALGDNPATPVTSTTASDETKNKEPRTVILQVPLDKHRAVKVHLTPTEKEQLKDYLDTSSMDKFLVGLLEAIRDQALPIRNAASEAMSHFFVTEPSLANAKTFKLIEKHFLEGDADLWFGQGLCVLSHLARGNNELASAAVKLAFRTIKKQIDVRKPIEGSNAELMLIVFTIGAVDCNPHCISVLLRIAEDDMQVLQEDRNEDYRFLILNVLHHVTGNHKEAIAKNEKYLPALFKISFTNYPDQSTLVNNQIRSLLNTVEKIDPAYSKQVFETLLHQTKKQGINEIIPTLNKLCLLLSTNAAYIPETLPVAMQLLESDELMSSRSMLIFATMVDHQNDTYDKQVFHALIEKLDTIKGYNNLAMPNILLLIRALVERHPTWAKEAVIPVSQQITSLDREYKRSPGLQTLASILKADPTTLLQALKVANEKLAHSNELVCINGLTLLQFLADKDPVHYESIFQLTTNLVSDKNRTIRAHTLLLVETLVKLYPACEPRALEIARQAFQDKEIVIRKRALYLLEVLIKTNKSYIPQACEIAKQAVYDKKAEVRKANIGLLEDILEADPSYAQNPNVRYLLNQAKLDKNKDIRQSAEKLLASPSVASK